MGREKHTMEWMNGLPRGVTQARRWNTVREIVHDFRNPNNVGKVLKIGKLKSQKEGWSAASAAHDEANRYCHIKLKTRTVQEADGTWSTYIMRKPDLVAEEDSQ